MASKKKVRATIKAISAGIVRANKMGLSKYRDVATIIKTELDKAKEGADDE